MEQNSQPFQGTPDWLEAERRRAAVAKSYTTPAIIVLVLYFVLWIPGIVANIVYLVDARKTEQLIGRAPEGKGCLTALLITFIIVPLALIVILLLFGGLAAIFSAHG